MRLFQFRQVSRKSLRLMLTLLLISVIFLCYRLEKIRRSVSSKTPILELMGSTDAFQVVKPFVNTIISQPSNIFLADCANSCTPFAVIIVISMPQDFLQRSSIRNTWARWAPRLGIRVFFMFGLGRDQNNTALLKELLNEQRKFDDLIIDDFEEGYYKLSGKVLRILKWYNNSFTPHSGPRFFVKTDEDVFIHLPNLVAVLSNTSYSKNIEYRARSGLNSGVLWNSAEPDTYFVGGKRFLSPPVDTDIFSKWYISTKERSRMGWPIDRYPTYVNGPCYVFSGNIVTAIYESSLGTPIFPFEDIHVTGMVAGSRMGLSMSHIENMVDSRHLKYLRHEEEFGKLVSVHPLESPEAMTSFWRTHITLNINCSNSGHC